MTDEDIEVFHIYSRRQAIADGLHHDVSKVACEAGIRYPTFITAGVLSQCVKIPAGVDSQDEEGRLWDVLWMLVVEIRRTRSINGRLTYQLYVRNTNEGEPSLVTLEAVCGPLDFDDPSPAITIMLPEED